MLPKIYDETVGQNECPADVMRPVGKSPEHVGWQPISTCPRSGEAFLACVGNWMTVAHWHRHLQCLATNGPTYERYPTDEMPTHWMPLPNSPEEMDSAPQVVTNRREQDIGGAEKSAEPATAEPTIFENWWESLPAVEQNFQTRRYVKRGWIAGSAANDRLRRELDAREERIRDLLMGLEAANKRWTDTQAELATERTKYAALTSSYEKCDAELRAERKAREDADAVVLRMHSNNSALTVRAETAERARDLAIAETVEACAKECGVAAAAWGGSAGDHARALADGIRRILKSEVAARVRQVQEDAERYRWLREKNIHTHYGSNHISGISPAKRLLMAVKGDPRLFECITCEIPLAHIPRGGEPIWCRKEGDAPDAEPEHFDFAANMDAAIDAARKERTK